MIEHQRLLELLADLGLKGFQDDEHRGEIRALCPFHNDHKPSWSISSTRKGHPWNCFKCGGGDIIGLVAKIRGKRISNARSDVLMYGDPEPLVSEVSQLPAWEDRFAPQKVHSKIREIELAAYSLRPQAIEYLRSRGVPASSQVIKRKRVGYDRKKNRLVFFWYWNKRVVGTSFRSIDEKFRGVEAEKSLVPYSPLDVVKRRVVVVEGELDAIKVSCVFPSVVALGSTRLSKDVVDSLVHRGALRLDLWFDRDESGREGFIRAVKMLRKFAPYMRVYSVPYPKKSVKDPGDPNMKLTDIKMCLDAAKSVTSFVTKKVVL